MKVLLVFVLVSCVTFGFGFLLKNVNTGLCIKDGDPNSEVYVYGFESCESGGTQFTLLDAFAGKRLASAWTQRNAQRPMQKCAYASPRESQYVWTSSCSGREDCPDFWWTLKEVREETFIIYHARAPMDNWCIKTSAAYPSATLHGTRNCNESDTTTQWVKV